MAGIKISSGSNSHGFTKADRQVRRGDGRLQGIVEYKGRRYRCRRVSPHSESVCRTADNNKFQGNSRKRELQSSPSPSSTSGKSSSAYGKRFHHDDEPVLDADDKAAKLIQITGKNSYVVKEYIKGRSEAQEVIKTTVINIKNASSSAHAFELIKNLYHPLIPDDKISGLKEDLCPVNFFLKELSERCLDERELFKFAKLTLELLVSKRVTCDIFTHVHIIKIYNKVSHINGAECLLKRDKVVGNPEDWIKAANIKIIIRYLKLCLQIKYYQEAKTVINALIKVTDHTTRFLFNYHVKNTILVIRVLNYCSAVGDFELAKKIINPENHYCYKWNAFQNKFLYNTFLNLCLELGEYSEAEFIVDLFMRDNNIEDMLPDPVTVTTMLKYCIFLKDYDLARRLIFGTARQPSYISKWKIQPNEKMYNGYIRVCLEAGKFVDIEPVISELDKYAQDKNSDPSQRPIQDSCFVILEYCLETKNLSLVKRLLFGADGQDSLIRQWNIPYSTLFFNLYLRVCTNAGDYQQAEQAINEFINRAKHKLYKYLHPDCYTAGAILEFCKAVGNVDLVKKIVFSGEADRGCVDLRDVKINSICLFDYITACAELRMFKEAKEIIDKIIKSAECGQAYLNVCPDINIVVAILKYCEQADDIDLADLMVFGNDKQQSYLSKWEIEPNFRVYAQWALVDKNNFAKALNKLIERRICIENSGYYLNGEFDTHIDQVFEKKYCVDDNGKKYFRPCGLPSEFAEALFEYHYYGCDRNIKQVIIGYHGSGALFDKFTDVLDTKFKLKFEPSAKGGRIVIKKTESETVKPED